jgi:diacylglycerol kinase (ATP)
MHQKREMRAGDSIRGDGSREGPSRPGAASNWRGLAVERLLRPTFNSWTGLCAAAQTEAAVREELVAAALAVPLAFLVADGTLKRFTLIAVVVFVLVVELLNTAIEKLADEITTDRQPGIGRVKDMASAAVGISLLVAGLVWLAALGERFAVW